MKKVTVTPLNAVVLNGKATELTEKQVKSIIDSLGFENKRGSRRLSDIKEGDTFKIGKHEFIVLEKSGDTTAALSKSPIEYNVPFGDPDFEKSNVRKVLVKFGAEIACEIGPDALVSHTVDQTTLDGMKHYGSTRAQVSLMTIDHVRRYADVLDNHKVDKWYWLATPWSAPARVCERGMCVVAPAGYVSRDGNHFHNGVRPFCILKSDIFVS
jgi:hypothetical protein